MKKLKHSLKNWLITSALVLAPLTGCAPPPVTPQPTIPENFAQTSSGGKLKCGAAKVKLTPYPNAPIAGYGPFIRHSNGVFFDEEKQVFHDCFSRSVVFSNGGEFEEGKKFLSYTSVDLLLISDELEKQVESEIPKDVKLILSATHTHSSIGGYWDAKFPEIASIGKFDQKNLNYLSGKISQSINEAESNIAPASLGFSHSNLQGLTRNRRSNEGEVDTSINVIHFKDSSKKNLADLIWFQAHPTIMPYMVFSLSSDFPGAVTRSLDEKNPPNYVSLFFQGAAGDISTKESSSKKSLEFLCRINSLGDVISKKVEELRKTCQFSELLFINNESPQFNFSPVYLQNSSKGLFAPLFYFLGKKADENLFPPTGTIELTHLDNSLQDFLIASFPFEVYSNVGLEFKEDQKGYYDGVIFSTLSQGYYGYINNSNSKFEPKDDESFFDTSFTECLMPYVGKLSKIISKKDTSTK